jgi:hypothetical protein
MTRRLRLCERRELKHFTPAANESVNFLASAGALRVGLLRPRSWRAGNPDRQPGLKWVRFAITGWIN